MLEVKIDHCSQCNNKTAIVNKKYYLCPDCNRERLDNQSGTKKEKQKNLLRSFGIKPSKLNFNNKPRTPIKQKSDKQKQIDKDYAKVCQEIASERILRCAGCNIPKRPLSYSHLIPRSLRRDLVACKENIAIHCLEWDGVMGCHNKWEDGLWEGMKDLEENLKKVKELDINYYNKIINKFKKDEIQEN